MSMTPMTPQLLLSSCFLKGVVQMPSPTKQYLGIQAKFIGCSSFSAAQSGLRVELQPADVLIKGSLSLSSAMCFCRL